jgi:hypothetical protein
MVLKAKEPFRFYSRLHLVELTGLRASNLTGLLELIKTVPGSSIYHHTHRSLEQHHYLSPEPPNDFAYWVTEELGDPDLGEKLSSIDTIQFSTIRNLRDKISTTIEGHLIETPSAQARFVEKPHEFHFLKSKSFIFPTHSIANNLKEFAEILKTISVDSLYFHIFESRLRLEKGDNDFSLWIENSVGNPDLAAAIARLDPYTYTMNGLRKTLIKIVESGIS